MTAITACPANTAGADAGTRSLAHTRAIYVQRADRFRVRAARLERQVRLIWILLAASAGALVAIVVARAASDVSLALWIVGAGLSLLVGIIATAILLKRQDDAQFERRLAQVNTRAIAAVDRDWDQLPAPEPVLSADRLALADDLDLFGQASLFQLVCRARSTWGIKRMADWLAVPASGPLVRRRQAAVRGLISDLEYRQRLEATASLLETLAGQSERFAAWLRESHDERWLRPAVWIARVLTAAAVISLIWFLAAASGSRAIPGFLFTGVVLVNILFAIGLLGRVHALFAVVSEGSDDVTRYRRLIDAACRFTPAGEYDTELHATVARAGHGIRWLERLTWLSRAQNLKFALLFAASPPVFFLFLLYVALQFVCLWDFHVAAALSAWRRRFGPSIDESLEAVGELEALSSLAALAHEQPDWTFAEFRGDGARVIEAVQLGHPLLPPGTCVRNDVTVGPPGSVLVVTGSNMSGKSTLLRALGTNVVLAQAGGPVCARSLVLPPIQIATAMRVTDSLEAGISLFMAELLAIRRVVDAADRLDAEREPLLLYLLDEILLGTNNAERQMAAASVLSYLLTKNAIGAVSTHDLDLVTHPAIAEGCRAVYFRESFVTDGPNTRMVFDYLMRSGVAPTTNVPFLLKAVGLPTGPATAKKASP